ncbi:MAG TPA: DUF971 domain-containing protein [Terriglobia bacterium]|nr:DUF971 domain-containing protein [Terriglobia bacterium]
MIPTNVKLDAGNGSLLVRWSDGHESRFEYQYLRDACPCATCIGADRHGSKGRAVTPLPMFTKTLRPERAEVVGRYALQIYWSDGHSAGIYSFPYLRGLCACEECSSRRNDMKAMISDE